MDFSVSMQANESVWHLPTGSGSYLGGLEDPIIESNRSDAVGFSAMETKGNFNRIIV